ncbi:MAG: hypothetical protein KJN99_09990 [Marinicaulis sp.]|nr:hypothetical protein [Marinicaulis sp.]
MDLSKIPVGEDPPRGAFDGSIDFNSTPGDGAEFYFDLLVVARQASRKTFAYSQQIRQSA